MPVTNQQELFAALAAGTVGGVWTHPVYAFLQKQYRQIKQRYKW